MFLCIEIMEAQNAAMVNKLQTSHDAQILQLKAQEAQILELQTSLADYVDVTKVLLCKDEESVRNIISKNDPEVTLCDSFRLGKCACLAPSPVGVMYA